MRRTANQNTSWPRMTKDEIVERMNNLRPDRVVKALLFERPDDAQGASVGVGVLLSNVVSLDGDQPARSNLHAADVRLPPLVGTLRLFVFLPAPF